MKMQQEIYHLSQVLRVNGFPETLLKKTVATHPSRLPEPWEPQQQKEALTILCTTVIISRG